jgi:hypothetical protein
MTIEQIRILRLAIGTALCLWVSQVFAWPLSFVAAVFTLVLLGLPMPALPLKSAISFVLVMLGSLYAGALLLPGLNLQPAVGLLLLIIALFWSFYFTAKGGSALLGTFATLGIAMTTAVGSTSIEAVFILANSLAFSTAVGIVFVWIGHALLPDGKAIDAPPTSARQKPPTVEVDLADARWSAFRSLLIVFPVALWFLLSPSSAAYLPVMIKVASMGQQATNEDTKFAAKSLIQSTLIGGVAAVIAWRVLSFAPSLTLYILLVAIAALVIGKRIFKGPGMHPNGATWSYGLLTMIVILAPAVMDSAGGSSAGAKFWERLLMFMGTALYAVAAVYITDAIRPAQRHAHS